ncbi:uncharacterized protein LOC130914703 [Corythoichthys intestinalis]|uniref:uncharacterized protein LOC130914703 n=1 Tax=Corythoichthys intestinalis TaxID=161448 RepID=UPI0025A5A6ED|nr:uncharacterized protein LOC130914703 [Corythoichthys intestinalis]
MADVEGQALCPSLPQHPACNGTGSVVVTPDADGCCGRGFQIPNSTGTSGPRLIRIVKSDSGYGLTSGAKLVKVANSGALTGNCTPRCSMSARSYLVVQPTEPVVVSALKADSTCSTHTIPIAEPHKISKDIPNRLLFPTKSGMPRFDRCIDDILDLFDEYANDESECLSRDEFKQLATSILESKEYCGKLESIDLDELFDRIDTNNDGELNYKEYVRCLGELIVCFRKKNGRRGNKGGCKGGPDMPPICKCINDIIDFFETHSTDGSDCLNKEQFKTLATSEINSSYFSGKLEPSKVDELFDKLDTNSDGELTFREYIKCIGEIMKCMRNKTGRRFGRGGRGGRGGRCGRGDRGGRDCRGSDNDGDEGGKGKGGKGGRGSDD